MIFNRLLGVQVCSIILLFIFNSCSGQPSDCIELNLSKEEKGWFNNYVDGDTIYFKDQENEIDSFIVHATDLLSYTTCNVFELGPFIYQLGSFSFRSIDNYPLADYKKRYSLGFDKIGQDSTDLNCKKGIDFFDLSTIPFYDFSKVPKQEFTMPTTGKKIEIYIYTKNYNCSNQEGGTEIMQEFAISKEYGLIWYKTLKGDSYSRIW